MWEDPQKLATQRLAGKNACRSRPRGQRIHGLGDGLRMKLVWINFCCCDKNTGTKSNLVGKGNVSAQSQVSVYRSRKSHGGRDLKQLITRRQQSTETNTRMCNTQLAFATPIVQNPRPGYRATFFQARSSYQLRQRRQSPPSLPQTCLQSNLMSVTDWRFCLVDRANHHRDAYTKLSVHKLHVLSLCHP